MPTNNRFLQRTKRLRIAAFVDGTFPDLSQSYSYSVILRLCEQVDADYRYFYGALSKVEELDTRAKAWLQHGFPAPNMDVVTSADLDHFRHVDPARFGSTVDAVADRLGCSPDAALQLPAVQHAFSMARWIKAWAPDVVTSFYSFEGSLNAFVAASMLDLPRVLFLHDDLAANQHPLVALLPLHLAQAELVYVPRLEVLGSLTARFGEALRERVICEQGTPDFPHRILRRVEDVLRKRTPAGERPELGPGPAFRTERQPGVATPEGQRPFVVLGAERTGSNLLVDMLSTHPHIVSAGELFNTRMMAEDRIDTQLPPGLDPIAMLELRKRDPAACLERVLAAGNANGATAAGFKLLYLHALACNPVVDHLLALPDLRIVHLAREDRLARWVSQVRAELADTWWIAADPSAAPRRTGAIDLDATATLWNFEWQELLEERLRATFAGHSSFDLSYEQLSGDLQGQAGRVLDYLGVEPQPLEVNSAKSGERDPRQWIANLAQLHLAFAGTRWQSMFAQPDRPRLQETAGPARLAGCGSAAMVAPEGANEALELIQRRFDDLVVTLGELTAASETLREELRSAQRMLRASQAFDGDALTEPSETSRN